MATTIMNQALHYGIEMERELLSSAIAGDGESFARLVRPHLTMMYSLARRWSSSPAVAEEAVQESLTTVFLKLGSYTPGTSFRAFLAGVVIKKAATAGRSERRLRNREEKAWIDERLESEEDSLSARQTARMLGEALAGMPEKRRKAAILRLESDFSYKEIAETLKTTEQSARVLVHMAMKDLKALVRQDGN